MLKNHKNSLTSSLVTPQSFDSPKKLIQKFRKENVLTINTSPESPRKTKYTHFPKEEDFIGKGKIKNIPDSQ